jgi:hypothetical protein
MTLKFSLKDLLVFTALIAIACAALANAGIWWHSIVVTATITGMTALVLWGVLNPGPGRAFAMGWMLLAAGYLGLIFGPWTESQLGPSLITARGLAQLEYSTRGNNLSPPVLQVSPQTDFSFGSDLSLIYSGSTITSGSVTSPPARIWASTGTAVPAGVAYYDPPIALTYTTFQSTGHWLLASLFGFGGAHLAAFLYRARRKTA